MNYVQRALDTLVDECPGLDPDLAQLYALLALTKGPYTSLEDVHDAWALYRMTSRPDHPCLVPFHELSAETQELDQPFMKAIRRTAERLRYGDDLSTARYGACAP